MTRMARQGVNRVCGKSPRLYPGALVWCLKKPGKDLRDKVELWLAWRRVAREVAEGTLGGEFDRSDRADLQAKTKDAEDSAKEQVWGDYKYAVIGDGQATDGLKVIDLGAGHSSQNETLAGRVIAALKAEGLLSESVGAGYIDRNWPPALKGSGAWSLASLRQSFLNGSLTRLIDPDAVLRTKIVEFVSRADFGLASGQKPDGSYERVWFGELVSPDEISFDAGAFLLRKSKAEALKAGVVIAPSPTPTSTTVPEPLPLPGPRGPGESPASESSKRTLRLVGSIPPELWNRFGTKTLPKLRSGENLTVALDFSVVLGESSARNLELDLRQVLEELGLADRIQIL